MDKVSVITINYNSAKDLEETIQSVINQEYPALEYIVIDGGSTDGSVDVIKKYSEHISIWISEPDKGIYDAMNKGLDLSTGEWINFKNSGDRFASPKVLRSIPLEMYRNEGVDVVYGPSYTDYGHTIIDQPSVHTLNLSRIYRGRTMPPHQSSMIRATMFLDYRYPTTYKVASDYDFILKAVIENKKIIFDPISSAQFKMGGISSSNDLLTVTEKYIITKSRLKGFHIPIVYTLFLLEILIKSFFKKNKFLYKMFVNYKKRKYLNK